MLSQSRERFEELKSIGFHESEKLEMDQVEKKILR